MFCRRAFHRPLKSSCPTTGDERRVASHVISARHVLCNDLSRRATSPSETVQKALYTTCGFDGGIFFIFFFLSQSGLGRNRTHSSRTFTPPRINYNIICIPLGPTILTTCARLLTDHTAPLCRDSGSIVGPTRSRYIARERRCHGDVTSFSRLPNVPSRNVTLYEHLLFRSAHNDRLELVFLRAIITQNSINIINYHLFPAKMKCATRHDVYFLQLHYNNT